MKCKFVELTCLGQSRYFIVLEKMKNESHQRLAVFKSESGVTLSFGQNTYFIESNDPFHNIALKAIERADYVPFYVEIAKREGLGPEFRDALLDELNKLNEDL